MKLIDLVGEREVVISKAIEEEKAVLRQLLQFYLCELSAYTKSELNRYGEFGYRWLDSYWIEGGRFPFLFRVDGNLAGFALINKQTTQEGSEFSMAEFYILPRYRKIGIGRHVAEQLFMAFRGHWEVCSFGDNADGAAFWIKVIAELTEGDFQEFPRGSECCEGPLWTFDSREIPVGA